MNNITLGRESLRAENVMLRKQQNIYCNSAKRMYLKLIEVYHLSEIWKEQYRNLFPFLVYEREKIDTTPKIVRRKY